MVGMNEEKKGGKSTARGGKKNLTPHFLGCSQIPSINNPYGSWSSSDEIMLCIPLDERSLNPSVMESSENFALWSLIHRGLAPMRSCDSLEILDRKVARS